MFASASKGGGPGWKWGEELFSGLLSGTLLAFSFPPYPTRFLSLVAFVPLFWYFLRVFPRKVDLCSVSPDKGMSRRRFVLTSGLLTGFSFGVSFFSILIFWIANLIPESAVHNPKVILPGLVLLVLYLSCYHAVFTVILAALSSRFGIASLISAPALWSLVELARSRGELGFSWGVAAYSLAPYPMTVQGAAIYGVFGLSLMIVLFNLLVAFAVLGVGGGKRSRVSTVVLLVLLAAVHLVWGKLEMSKVDSMFKTQSGVKVAVVQPNTDLGIKWNPAYKDTIFSDLESLAREAALKGAGLVVFPETAAPVSFKVTPQYLHRLEDCARENGVDILIGYIDHTLRGGAWQSHNAAGLISSRGVLVDSYHKINLLPFGEKIPFSQYIPALSRIDFGQANFIAGKKRTVFPSAAGRFSVLICFESTFSELTRLFVRDGAQFLVNITNDGWFGSERGPEQHAEMAILRAVENRVMLLRAANTGVSMIVDPAGRVKQKLGMGERGILFGRVVLSSSPTPFTRFGHLIFLALVAVEVVVAAIFYYAWKVRSVSR